MMSATARARRRGAVTRDEFLQAMASVGFIAVHPTSGELHAFVHPDRIGLRFRMALGDTYTRALARLLAELEERHAAME